MQAFLGLLNFYHIFLPKKATVAEPLHWLLHRGVSWKWTIFQKKAFQGTKELLTADALLVHFDEKKPLLLTCDASPYGVEAVLSHQLKDNSEALIAFYSRSMNDTETLFTNKSRSIGDYSGSAEIHSLSVRS